MIHVSPILQLAIGMIGLSWALAHAWWCVVRVVNLRQDILDIRDRLFDAAIASGGVDDPAHRAARDHLNTIAAIADCLNLWVVGFVLGRGVQNEAPNFHTTNPKLEKAIGESIEQSAARLSRYLLRETTPGLILTVVVFFARLGRVFDHQMIQWTRRLLLSNAPDDLRTSRTGGAVGLDC